MRSIVWSVADYRDDCDRVENYYEMRLNYNQQLRILVIWVFFTVGDRGNEKKIHKINLSKLSQSKYLNGCASFNRLMKFLENF